MQQAYSTFLLSNLFLRQYRSASLLVALVLAGLRPVAVSAQDVTISLDAGGWLANHATSGETTAQRPGAMFQIDVEQKWNKRTLSISALGGPSDSFLSGSRSTFSMLSSFGEMDVARRFQLGLGGVAMNQRTTYRPESAISVQSSRVAGFASMAAWTGVWHGAGLEATAVFSPLLHGAVIGEYPIGGPAPVITYGSYTPERGTILMGELRVGARRQQGGYCGIRYLNYSAQAQVAHYLMDRNTAVETFVGWRL